ncbi:nucleotide sugar dehydrogenase, partial [Bacillus thuringiensis]|nr:nucleotide sugar dehydrogenase [Bacillus thuringiensis]
NKPFNVPVFKTTIRSSEMIKYAANAFLATKISFINEIANICEKLGADVEHVANGMGLDKRIGTQFLKAGIGYGGSCFPKDTHALIQIAGNVEHDFDLLKSVITVNNNQQASLVEKIKNVLGDMEGKQVAMLGLAFKPNTDDMREAASIVIANDLVKMGAKVVAYDPIATENAKKVLPNEVQYVPSVAGAVKNADVT